MLVLFEPCRLLPFYVALAVAFSTVAFGAEILSQVDHDFSYGCQEQKHVATTKYNVSGIELTRRSFTCIDDMPISKRRLSTRAELQQNNAVECHTDESCQCGIQSKRHWNPSPPSSVFFLFPRSWLFPIIVGSCSCSSEPDFAPSVNDCSALVDALQVVTQVAGPTFVTESGGFELISFQVYLSVFSSIIILLANKILLHVCRVDMCSTI